MVWGRQMVVSDVYTVYKAMPVMFPCGLLLVLQGSETRSLCLSA